MCGISGIIGVNPDQVFVNKFIDRSSQYLHTRGPDACNISVLDDGKILLYHSRLSIVDRTEDANQPFFDPDTGLTIVFNGEVFNYSEIKRQLENLGHKFKTESDTEVFVKSFAQWGHAAFNKIIGFFAVAIYSDENKKLTCARDILGKKPFYYRNDNDLFSFSSSINVLASAEFRISKSGIAKFFSPNCRNINYPFTIYNNIIELEPGSVLEVSIHDDNLVTSKIEDFVDLGYTNHEFNLIDTIDAAIKQRIDTDLDIGLMLSGGIDSTLLLGKVSDFKRDSSTLYTYSVGLQENDPDAKCAQINAIKCGTKHKTIIISPDELWDRYALLVREYGQPIWCMALLYTDIVSEYAKKDGLKILLSGNGADEIFFGYNSAIRNYKIYRTLLKFTQSQKISSLIYLKLAQLRELLNINHETKSWFTCKIHFRSNVELKMLNGTTEILNNNAFRSIKRENSHSMLIAPDIGGMKNSVEIRSPYLDKKLLRLTLSIPVKEKLTNKKGYLEQKAMLKDILSDEYPELLVANNKMGFGYGLNERSLFADYWRTQIEGLLRNFNDCDGLLSKQSVVDSWTVFLKNPQLYSNFQNLQKILMLQLWINVSKINE